MHERFDALARDLARGDLSRRRFLRLLGGLGGAAGLAALGIRPASAQGEEDPLMISGHTRSQLEALRRTPPPNQAQCAHLSPPYESCFLGICTFQCPEGLFGTGACVAPADGNGRPRCVGNVFCSVAEECFSNADCGPREFCGRTCCPPKGPPGSGIGTSNRCVPICAENNP